MDTPHHNPTPEAEQPAAVVQPGNPAERPQGTVGVEWNMSVEEMLNERGFAAFLENYKDSESLEMTEDNKDEIAARFRAFDANKTIARQFEVAMNQKLQADGKGRMNAEERQAYRDYVTEKAANDPDSLVDLQNDLRALEENPEKIRQKEAELARLREDWDAEKIKAGIAELQEKKATVEKLLVDTDATKFSRTQHLFFSNFGARFNVGKIAKHAGQRTEWIKEFQEVDSTLKAAEEALASAPEMLADTERKFRAAAKSLEDAQESIFVDNKAAKMIRERLIKEAREQYDSSLESMDITTLQKTAEQFRQDEKLATKGNSDYLGFTPDDAEAYKALLSEQIEKVIATSVLKALETLPLGATQSRLERALRTFTDLGEKGLGFADASESKEFVLNVLREAEQDARKKSKGSGKSIMLKHLISKLSK